MLKKYFEFLTSNVFMYDDSLPFDCCLNKLIILKTDFLPHEEQSMYDYGSQFGYW